MSDLNRRARYCSYVDKLRTLVLVKLYNAGVTYVYFKLYNPAARHSHTYTEKVSFRDVQDCVFRNVSARDNCALSDKKEKKKQKKRNPSGWCMS